MLVPFDPGPLPRGLVAWLGEIPESTFDQQVYACCELVERYATDLALDLIHRLELEPALRLGAEVETLLAERRYESTFRPALVTLLDRLVEAGELTRDAGTRRYAAPRPLRPAELEALRDVAARLDSRLADTLALFDAAADAYPAVAQGGTTGEKELLSPGRIGLWLAYFSNRNPVYALNNRLAAIVAARRLRSGPDLRVLEVGAGAASATFALLEEIERVHALSDLARFDFTEPSPFLRRRGERELRERYPALTLRSRALDIDLPLAAQDAAPRSYDLVCGVNVLHVARDLGRTLAALRETLVPGGWLVVGECLRLFPGQTVAADLIFQIFRGFVDVELDADLRPAHGFLEPATWRRALAAAGFDAVEVVPDLDRIRDRYPRFFTGVVCGRRPPVEPHPGR